VITIEYRKRVEKYINDHSVVVSRHLSVGTRKFTLVYHRPMRRWETAVNE
jgi:hypothetical protein